MSYPSVFRRLTKRENGVVRGLRASEFMVRFVAGGPKYRIYEAWDKLDQRGSTDPKKWAPVPLVIVIKGERQPFDRALLP